ncbi:nucleic acid-binding protein [Mycobacterium sp. 050128]|uniref:nucleic acid-binding protein n=1 Tax=Mycobacterium sp. 050128 TaxID=3096112 RepID=UPI002ED7E926
MITDPLYAALNERIPEIANRLVEVVAIARHPGVRAKVAVRGRIPGINPVGVCIGWCGLRIADVEKRLHGERVSIVAHDSDPTTYATNALGLPCAHAEVISTEQRRIRVIVHPDDYRRALGKAGSNISLARELTGWSIEIQPSRDTNGESPLHHSPRLALIH